YLSLSCVAAAASAAFYTLSLHDALPIFTVEAADEIQLIEIFDISGRLLQATRPAAGSVLLDLTHRRAGIYFFKIRTSHGTAMRKDRKSTRLNSSHVKISYAVFCLKKKNV